jgi:SSS family solute:Na+ symporter
MGIMAGYRNAVIVTLLVYFGLTLWLGYQGRTRKGEEKEGLKNWAVAGRNVGWVILGLAWSATYFSSYAVLGVAGEAYRNGISIMTISTAYFIPTAILMYIMGSAVNILGRKNNYMTIGDLLQDRFESKWVRLPLFLTMLIFSGYYVGIQLIGASVVLEQLAGIPFLAATILGAAVLAVYVSIGGFKSTALTDTLQAALLFVALFGGGLMAIYLTKGQLFTMLASRYGIAALTSPGLKSSMAPNFAFSFNINIIIYTFGYMFMQWCLAASGPGSLRRAAGTYSIICPAGYIFGSILLGLAGLAMGIHVEKADQIFPVVVVQFFGPLFGAMLVAGVLGATQSTAASILAGVSLSSSYDFYKKMVNPEADPKKVLFISRALTYIILGFSIVLAVTAKTAIMFLGAIGIAFFSVMAPVILAALYWPRATKEGAISAPFIGLLVLIYVIFVKKNFLGIHPGLWGFAASLIALVVISLMTAPSPKATVDRIHGVIGRIYHKSPDQLWYPTTGKGIIATLVVVAEVFAISYGLYYLKTEKIIFGMAAQYAWVLGWVLAALVAQFVLFKHVRIDENV